MLPEIYVLKPIVEKKRSYCFHEYYGIYFLDRPLIRNTCVSIEHNPSTESEKPVNLTNCE
jgi:hypothetical protein